jgi:hypothetical protein
VEDALHQGWHADLPGLTQVKQKQEINVIADFMRIHME